MHTLQREVPSPPRDVVTELSTTSLVFCSVTFGSRVTLGMGRGTWDVVMALADQHPHRPQPLRDDPAVAEAGDELISSVGPQVVGPQGVGGAAQPA